MVENNYNVSQATLYLATPIIAASLTNELALFTAFQPRFKPAFITAVLDKLAACQALPDEEQRNEMHETKRNLVLTDANACLKNFRSVKLYIKQAYGVDAPMYIASAGGNYYDQARNYNWKSLKQMNTECIKFLEIHKSALEDNDNMPNSFAATYTTASDKLSTDLLSFYAKTEETRILTAQKIELNNELYAMLIDICDIGRHLFENNEEMRRQFTFDSVVELISPKAAAGVKLSVVNGETQQPMVGVLITVKNTDKVASTDDKGVATIEQLSAEEQTIVIDADGFKLQEIKKVLKAGVTSRIDVVLEPLFEPIVENVVEPVVPVVTPEPVPVV